jgi:hypothetical protein
MFSELVPELLEYIRFIANGKRTNPMGWMADHVFVHMPDAGWAAFAYSVFTLGYCFIPVWIMYRKRIFLKV